MHNHKLKLYTDWRWGEHLDYINNIIYHSGNIILVSGLIDSGKTTLKQEIINAFLPKTRYFAMVGDQRLNARALVRQVMIGFGVPCDHNVESDWDDLCRDMAQHQDTNWILLIDDAEKLAWDVFTSLIDLYINAGSNNNKFSLVIFADLILVHNIRNSALKDFFTVKFQIFQLDSLNFEQMKMFVYNTMQLTLDIKILKKIYKASNGIIGKVKQLAIAELKLKEQQEQNFFNKFIAGILSPIGIRLLVSSLLLSGAYAVFYINNKYRVSGEENFTQSLQVNQVKSSGVTVANSTSTALLDVTADNTTVDNESSGGSSLDSATLKLVKEDQQKFDLQTDPKYQQLYQQLLRDLKENFKDQLADLSTKLNQLNSSQQLPSHSDSITTVGPSLGHTVTKEASHSNEVKNLSKNCLNPAEILQKSKKMYVLQLMASKHEQTARHLVNKYPSLKDKFGYFVGKFHPGKEEWYIVIYNSYKSPEAALKDIKNLPLSLQKLQPLVRDYASVHKLILNNNKKS